MQIKDREWPPVQVQKKWKPQVKFKKNGNPGPLMVQLTLVLKPDLTIQTRYVTTKTHQQIKIRNVPRSSQKLNSQLSSCKQLPFYFLCVFWGISPSRRTLGCYIMPRELSNFNMFPCSHGNISFLWNGKEARKSKVSGGSRTHVFSWGSRTPSGAPPSGEHTHMRTSPRTLTLDRAFFKTWEQMKSTTWWWWWYEEEEENYIVW
jgi:hypothetical protein